ncbi:MAG: acetyl-CoA C-acetyltransferase [Proteobacteria bacterium]|nr:MAG: acetyl-CoA C-acetyltransferase [Pseudomonadota bacterium]
MRPQSVYVVDGTRTPFLKARNGPGAFSGSDLAVAAGRALLMRQPFAPDAIDEVILGCMIPSPDEANIGRVVSLRMGCGHRVPGWTVQRNCASGMQAIDSALHNIASGRADLVLAGGTDSMSHAPVLWGRAMVEWLVAWQTARDLPTRLKAIGRLRPRHLVPVISLLRGLTDPTVNLSMGQTAEIVAQRFAIDRDAMDAFAVTSHQRLSAAQATGSLDEITPLFDEKGGLYETDDGVRPDSSLDKLAKLKPVFDRKFGNVTAGNSAQITDGAACLLLASEAAVKRHQLPVIGRIVDVAWAGLDPAEMGLGPAHAVPMLLKRQRIRQERIDYWEINEAFAAQVLAVLAAWEDKAYCRDVLGLSGTFGTIDRDRLNADGGAIALGHPIGASGARIVLHALKVLQREGGRYAVASLCIGGGQGGATLIEALGSSHG